MIRVQAQFGFVPLLQAEYGYIAPPSELANALQCGFEQDSSPLAQGYVASPHGYISASLAPPKAGDERGQQELQVVPPMPMHQGVGGATPAFAPSEAVTNKVFEWLQNKPLQVDAAQDSDHWADGDDEPQSPECYPVSEHASPTTCPEAYAEPSPADVERAQYEEALAHLHPN